MLKISKKNITVLIILVAVVFIFILRVFFQSSQANHASSQEAKRVKGNPKSLVKIIEFVDFECPACAQGALALKEVFKNHPDEMYLELKYFPLTKHRHAFSAARWAECALKQGQFWPFVYLLMERQNQWSILINADPAFRQFAKEIGLNSKKVETCLQDESIDQAIIADRSEGYSLGIKSTPTYFINGEMIVGPKSLSTKLAEYFKDVKKLENF